MATTELEIAENSPDLGENDQPPTWAHAAVSGVTIGVLIGFGDEGATPLVLVPGRPGTVAVRARATIDVHGAHIGRKVVLQFENGDTSLPIITGLLNQPDTRPLPDGASQVEVDADGERVLVSAKQQLVFRCGKASITLTRDGKVLIQGEFISSRSSGVNRIKGGSVQLN